MKKHTSLLAAGCLAASTLAMAESASVNVMLITADDLGYEAWSLFDSELPNLTPNMDRFAKKGMQFAHGHVNHSICQLAGQ